jgi:nitroreductase
MRVSKMNEAKFIKYIPQVNFDENEMNERSSDFLDFIRKRRTIREFSDKPVHYQIIENAVKSAGSAPSGANQQPWHFVVVRDLKTKNEIRIAAEKEEKEFYENRAPAEWLNALSDLGTDQFKSFLEIAPYLIVIFEKKYGLDDNNNKVKYYYTKESVGIACGILITALHFSGLATLTHTPSPMNFLNSILNRPANEKPYLIIVTGLPKKHTKVPLITKKSFDSICTIVK